MKPEDFTPYLTKFIAVRLDDGTMDAGYIAHPGDFRDFPDDNMRVRLINGLLQTEIEISRIRSITLPPREDTTKIPILGFDEPISTVQTMDRTEELNIEDKLDQLVERNLFEFPDLDELLNNDRK